MSRSTFYNHGSKSAPDPPERDKPAVEKVSMQEGSGDPSPVKGSCTDGTDSESDSDSYGSQLRSDPLGLQGTVTDSEEESDSSSEEEGSGFEPMTEDQRTSN